MPSNPNNLNIKSYALIITLIAIAYITLQLYEYTVRSLVYSSGVMSVYYEPRLFGGTLLELGLEGFQGLVAVRLYAPTIDGFDIVGEGSGFGVVEVDVSDYVGEAWNLTRWLGWSPDRAGPSILALILVAEEDKGRGLVNISTQAITIPLIPGKAEGKRLKVEVKPDPLRLATIKAKPGIEVKSPPDRVGEICTYYPGPGGGYECYYWELNQTLYEDRRGIPMLMTGILEYNDAMNIKEIINTIEINLYTMNAEYISFDLGLAITASLGSAEFTLHTPGPGFTIYKTGDIQQDNLFSLDCTFYSSVLSSRDSECKYMGVRWDIDVGEYSYYAVVATGFRGDLAYSEYLFVHESCLAGFCEREVLNTSHAVWAAPRSNSNGKIVPWQHVDDYAFDGENISELASMIRGHLQQGDLPTDSGGYTMVSISHIIIDSSSSLGFAFGLPIGSLILLVAGNTLPNFAWAVLPFLVVGVELGVTEVSIYSNLGYIRATSIVESVYDRKYYEVVDYYVPEEEAEYPVPVILFIPGIT